jgi:signal transduction histidine kinase
MYGFLHRIFANTKPIIFIVLITVGLAGMNLVWVLPSLNSIRVNASDRALNTAIRVRSDIKNKFDLAINDLLLATDQISFNSIPHILTLNRTLQRNTAIKSLAIADTSGLEFIKLDRLDIIQKKDFYSHYSEAYFQNALKGNSTIGSVFISEDFEPHVFIAVPQTELGLVKNVLIADYNLIHLVHSLDNLNSLSEQVFVIDQNGFQIFNKDFTEILKRVYFGDKEWVKKVINDKRTLTGLESEAIYRNTAGKTVFTVGLPFPTVGWGIFVEQDRSSALSEVNRTIMIAMMLFAVGLLASIAIIYSNFHLRELTDRLRILINENYESSKMLVKRDLELTEANMKMEQLDEVKSEFVSIAAHQLRTPLTGIRWSLHSLVEHADKMEPTERKIVQDALTITLSAIDLINDLLDVARIEEGKAGLNLRLQALKPIIEEEAEMGRKMAEAKCLTFSVFIADEIPRCLVDADKIGIAIENILNNAIKYTNPGGTVTLSVNVTSTEVEISVIDTGVGIPKSQQHRLFTQFFRASNARKMVPSSTGLGLFMTKNIIERHGGSISFVSEENEGTSVRVLIPRKV